MKVEIEKTFPLPGPADAAWAVLQDIDAVAGCMPGAKITERTDATHFKGTVGVKFGPASMSFRGDVEILSLDAATQTLRLMGKGTDSTGSSGASMDLTARVEAIDAAACNLVGTSEVAMSGKAAAFGGRMMDSVADQVLKQFAANFAPACRRQQAQQAADPEIPAARWPAEPRPIARSTAWRWRAGDCRQLAAQPVRAEKHERRPAHDRSRRACSESLAGAGYIAEPSLVAALLLMQDLGRPLLLEGDAGVGKTEVAKVLAQVRDTRLIRLQCYEGLDAHAAMYEWNYQRQLLAIKLLEQDERGMAQKEQDIFSERYLLKRPLLEAISCEQPPVLLIDEVDRADEAFEAYLLELLSDFQLSIPELGTVRATSRPLVVITSNGTRELSDALRRRCLYQFIDYPDHAKELAIVRKKAPEAAAALAQQIVSFVQAVRRMDLQKKPGIAETLDWTAALLRLGISTLERDGADRIMDTLSALIKTREDRAAFPREAVARLAAAC